MNVNLSTIITVFETNLNVTLFTGCYNIFSKSIILLKLCDDDAIMPVKILKYAKDRQ